MTADNHPEPTASAEAPPEIGYCWQCGYDLRGLDDQQCPECGFRFDVEAVRDMNCLWGERRLQGIRDATFLQSMALGILCVSIVIRASAFGPGRFLATAAAWIAIGIAMRSCRFCVLLGLTILFVSLLTPGSWFLYRLLLLFAGIIYGGVEWQRLVEGRQRGKMYGVREGLAQSIEFSARVNVALLVVSGVAMLLLIAVGR